MKALITGAGGFIGGHTALAAAARGWRVRGLVRPTSEREHLEGLDAEIIVGDLDDDETIAAAVAGVDVVIHLAALTCALTVERLHEVNVAGTERVVAACLAQPQPPTLVYVSSIAAAGPNRLGTVRVESDPPRPVSDYGRSKLGGELAVRRAADRLPATIVRPAIVFGPRGREMLPVFQTIRRLRVHPVAGWRQPPLSYIYAADLAEILVRAAERGARLPASDATPNDHGRGVYFAADESHPTWAEWGRMIRALLGRPLAPVLHIPNPVAYRLATANEWLSRRRGKADAFNRDKIREASQEAWVCSGAAAFRDLDFQPPHALAERLAETVSWYQDHAWL